MERLLAYEGPVVHVDHAHRAPARATGLEWRSTCEENVKSCEEKVERERRHKEMAKDKHREMVDQMAKEAAGRQEAEEALEKCDEAFRDASAYKEHVREGHEKEVEELEATVAARDEELAKARFQMGQLQASEVRMQQTISEYAKELAVDNKNYTKLLNGVYNEAKSKFVSAAAMARSKAEDGDAEELQYVRWLQKKLAELPEMDEVKAKEAVGNVWF